MKLAIVPALALAAGSVALMASPASATPEVRRHAPASQPAPTTVTPDAKSYGWDHHHPQDICYKNQFFPGVNILSGDVLNDVVDAPIDVIVQVLTLLTSANINSDKPIVNGNCN